MKAFITKYALTEGIMDEALFRAENMRVAKIEELEKQIEKLKQLEFKKP